MRKLILLLACCHLCAVNGPARAEVIEKMGLISAIRVQENGWIRVYFDRLFANGKCLDARRSAHTALNLKLAEPGGEARFNALLAAHLGPKEVFISFDDSTCLIGFVQIDQ